MPHNEYIPAVVNLRNDISVTTLSDLFSMNIYLLDHSFFTCVLLFSNKASPKLDGQPNALHQQEPYSAGILSQYNFLSATNIVNSYHFPCTSTVQDAEEVPLQENTFVMLF